MKRGRGAPTAVPKEPPPAPTGPGFTSLSRRERLALRLTLVLSGAAAWWLAYTNLEAFATWFTYHLLGMTAGTPLASAVAFLV